MRIVLIGACGHGKVCAEIASLMSGPNGEKKYSEILFLDNNEDLKDCLGYPVIGVEDDFEKYIDCDTDFFVSIGNGTTRKRIDERIINAKGQLAVLVHPNAVVSNSVEIGIGSVIMAGAVINPSVRIGKGVIVNTCSSIDHDCVIADNVHVAVGAHICGTVNVGECTWIGAGAIISNNTNICDDCMIGAGTVVIKNIVESGTYIGVPAKKK